MKRLLFYLIMLAIIGGIDGWFLSHYSMSFFAAVGILLFIFILLNGAADICEQFFLSAKAAGNLKIILTSLLITLIVAEGLLRLLKTNATYVEQIGQGKYFSPYWNDKNFWYLYNPNDTLCYSRKDFNYYRVTNSMGIPEREINLADTGNVKKILCLGDSFTEGMGTTADSSWPRALERYLNMQGIDSFMVYNAGISGSDPVFETHLLLGKLWQTKWNTVIFCINETDLQDCSIKGGMERFRADSTVIYRHPPKWEKLYAASYLFRLIINNGLHYTGLLLSKEEEKKFEQFALKDIQQTIDSVALLLQRRNTHLLVVVHPLKGEQYTKSFQNRDMDLLLSHLSYLKPVNLFPYFANDTLIDKNLYWQNDAHFKTEGYRLMAKEISRALLEQQKAIF